MSAAANVIELPARRADCALEHEIVFALATADDLASAMDWVVGAIRRSSGAARVEWWQTDDEGALRLAAAIGIARGEQRDLPVGRAGVVVLHGGGNDTETASALLAAAPIVRRRAAEERIERTAIDLARRNEALEDFAALVAHELKTPLHAALLADDASRHVHEALDLVEALLEAARTESSEHVLVAAGATVDQAVGDIGAEIEVTTDLQAMLPLPSEPLHVLLRNLLANAVAAGARHVHIAADVSPRSRRLVVDDDGVGLGEVDHYAAGSGIGLSLSRRIAKRFGGVLELTPHPAGGTRAMLEFPEVQQ